MAQGLQVNIDITALTNIHDVVLGWFLTMRSLS